MPNHTGCFNSKEEKEKKRVKMQCEWKEQAGVYIKQYQTIMIFQL